MTAFSTPLSRRLGLRYPLVAAPMFLVSNRQMLLACAEAGILGAMPSLNRRTSEAFAEDLAWLKARTDKPFAINVTIGLTEPERLERDVALCLEHEVAVMITSYGNPTEIVRRAHERDTIVFHDVINLRHGQKARDAGVDAIIAVSQGAGGHAGTVNPYVLVPWLRRELGVPIIAAGCISGGDQVAAALALGGELAYIGTRFIASEEAGAQDAYKALITTATHDDVVYTNEVSGVNANFLRQTLQRGASEGNPAKRWKDIWSAGQGVTLIDEVLPIERIVDDIVREYHDAKARLG